MKLRTPTRADAPAIAAICNALSRDLYGIADLDAKTVRDWFGLSDLGMFLVEQRGRAVGYADVRDDEHVRFPVDLRVHPDVWGGGVARQLLAAVEEWARGRCGAGAVLRGFAAERDAEVQRALADTGYRLIRHSFLMEIDLLGRLEEPTWPDGVTVRTYEHPRDEQVVFECVQEAFADHWDFHPIPLERWREFNIESASFEPSLWWLAEAGGELAAACLNAWHFSGDRTFGWIGTLGVRRPWRRQGLGLALLRHSFGTFAARGAARVGLGVDAENTTGAVRLYERAGMRPVRRNDTFEKPV